MNAHAVHEDACRDTPAIAAGEGTGDRSANQFVPSVSLDFSELPQRQRFDAWRSYCSPLFEIGATDESHLDPGARVTAWGIGSVALSDSVIAAGRYSLPQHRVRRLDDEMLTFRLFLTANQRMLYGESPLTIEGSELHMFDYAQDFRVLADHGRLVVAYVPYADVGYDPSRHPRHLRFSMETPIGRVLGNALIALTKIAPRLPLSEAQSISDSFIGLVRGLFRFDLQDEPARQATRDALGSAMRAWLDARLDAREVGINDLLDNFGASRATVFRCFAQYGGVSNYLIQRRLERSFRDLAGAPPARGRVLMVAQKWGFEDQGHFSRRFRDRFGFPPREAMDLAIPFDSTSSPVQSAIAGDDIVAPIQKWVGQS